MLDADAQPGGVNLPSLELTETPGGDLHVQEGEAVVGRVYPTGSLEPLPGTWTATLDGDAGQAEATATGETPAAAVAALDAATRCYDPAGEPLTATEREDGWVVTQPGSDHVLGRVSQN